MTLNNQVSAGFSVHNTGYMLLAAIKHYCQVALIKLSTAPKPAYVSDLIVRKLAPPMWIPLVSIFCGRIINILFLITKPKVGRVNTSRIVFKWKTVVKHLLTLRYFPVVYQPRGSVGEYCSLPILPHSDSTVSLEIASPQPAMICFINLSPKPIFECVGKSLRKCGVLSKLLWHIKSSFFGLLARRQLQLPRAPLFVIPFLTSVNSF